MNNARFAKVFFSAIFIVLAGCGEKPSGVGSSLASSPGGGGNDGTLPPADVSKFWVKVVQSSTFPMTTYLHKFGEFNQPCEIALNDPATDLKCMLNIREEDLYFYGLNWQVNVAPSMCQFVVHRPYYYYNFQPGFGPNSLSLNLESPGVDQAPVLTSCSIDSAPGTIQGNRCVFPGNEGYIDVTGKAYCAYNIEKGPQCCVGKYAALKTTRKITASGTTIEQLATDGDWGGEHFNCWGGLVTEDNWPKSKDQVPVTARYYEGRNGLLLDVERSSPLSFYGEGGNFHIANMYAWTAVNTNHSSPSLVPYGIKPTGDLSGTSLVPAPGNEAYTYECRDESGEVKHRIRLYVNEWNTNDEWAKFSTSSGAQGTPDRTGTDGTECATGSGVNASLCNDYRDWDDTGASFPREWR